MKRLGLDLCAFAITVGGTCFAQVTQRVSVTWRGAEVIGASRSPAISADGRFVAFNSSADHLVPADTNGAYDVFLRDRQSGTTELLSASSSERQGNDHSHGAPAISADGRYVAFGSFSTNLVTGDTNGVPDVFVRDRELGTTERVSVTSGGMEAHGGSASASISADGRFVAFTSVATDLVPGDTNDRVDIFLRDRALGTTERVSVGSRAVQADGDSDSPSVSADGRFVAFASYAPNLVTGDSNGMTDVFVRDREAGTTERVSVGSDRVEGDWISTAPSISADGRCVAFESIATNLVPGDTNGTRDIFVRDRHSGATERVSVSAGGAQVPGDSYSPSISADARFVAFASLASYLVRDDTNGWVDVFQHDRRLGTTECASVDSAGEQGGRPSSGSSISANGRCVAFHSLAADLVPADTNGSLDVFVHDFAHGGYPSLCDPGAAGVIACPCSNPPSGTERGCDNSSATGGAKLSASGGAFLSSDSLVWTTSGEKPTALSVVRQGTSSLPAGTIHGQGVRCAGGTIKRMYTKAAVGGSITAPNLGAGDPTVHDRSAALGDPIAAGSTRWYFVYYRDANVLGGCPAVSTFNATQTRAVTWQP